jgi:hypothetical protein
VQAFRRRLSGCWASNGLCQGARILRGAFQFQVARLPSGFFQAARLTGEASQVFSKVHISFQMHPERYVPCQNTSRLGLSGYRQAFIKFLPVVTRFRRG